MLRHTGRIDGTSGDAESEEIKAMYERRCAEELEDLRTYGEDSVGAKLAPDSHMQSKEGSFINSHSAAFLENRTLNLPTAARVASLIASYHVNSSSRDLSVLDFNQLLTEAMGNEYSIEEI